MLYRGPAKVVLDPEGYVKVVGDKVTVKATFTKPGTYTLRAFGHDSILRAPTDITISAGGPAPSEQR
jgi:hypothetical protein